MRTRFLMLFCLFALAFAPLSGHCDESLMSDPRNPYGYRLRDDRCEGLYLDEKSGGLRPASLHFAPLALDLRPGEPIELSWAASESEVHLRAVSLHPRLYYRMDSIRPQGAQSYRWPTDVLERAGLDTDKIGLLAWSREPVKGRRRDVYRPVSAGGGAAWEMQAISAVSLQQVYLTLYRINRDGSEDEILFDEPVRGRRFPANQPFPLPLPRSLAPDAVHRLELGGVTRGGGAASAEILFRTPPE